VGRASLVVVVFLVVVFLFHLRTSLQPDIASKIASGYSSCTATNCYERLFGPKTPFAAYAACNDIAKAWLSTAMAGRARESPEKPS